jgi:hypothetical protein
VSQKIILTVRAVGPDGDIRTFEDGGAVQEEQPAACVDAVPYEADI